MPKLPPIKQAIAERTVCVLLLRGSNTDGESIFAYIAIRADKLEEFMEAQKAGVFFPEHHGIVLESGVGEPNAEVKERMTREYGFNHEAMHDIPDALGARDLIDDIRSYMIDLKP